jgi:methylmalonyl-CoA mutase cobalamin-binding domain/chain
VLQEELLNAVENCLLKFDKKGMQAAVDNALIAGMPPSDVIAGIKKGFEEIGRRYEAGEYFLSELIMAGETAKTAIETLKPHFQKTARDGLEKVVIGTVEGDLHDIGKNLVGIILLSSGFDVYDLGIDVKSADYVKKVKETGAKILGLSALLTTTMLNMGVIIEDLKKAGLREKVKVIIGGQPTSQEFARQMGADAQVDDAPKVLKVIDKLLEM